VVGAAVLLDFLTGFLRAFDYPGGQLWLVDDRLQMLASSSGFSGPQLWPLDQVLPEGLRGLETAALLTPSRSFRAIGGSYVLAQAVGSTPWRLLYVIAPAELNAVILPRLVPYGIILVGLILTLLLAHSFRQRVIVRPALAFADYIRAESAERHPRQPRLPAFWQPLVTATGEAFRAQRSSLAQIQDSEAMKSAIIASAFDAVIAIDEAGMVVEFNPSAEQMFGIAGSQALGQPLAELIVPAHLRASHHRGMRRYLASGQSGFLGRRVELEALRADGTPFPVEIAVSEVRQAGRLLFAAYLRDITERRAMERALRESEQHFRVIAESHPVPVAIVRLADGRILHASQAFADLFGIALEELPGQDIERFYADREQRARLLDALHRSRAVHGFELDQRRPDGSVFPTALTSRLIDFEGAPAVISAVIDLTERKRQEAEIARQREALHQSEKLNALGSLLASVAHELNNPLSVVVGYATMMRDQAADDATRERAVKVQAAAERCARVVRTFLAMARQKPEAWGRVEINQVVESALEVSGYGLRTSDIEVALELARDLPPVGGDVDQLTLVMMNLVVNAQHALQTRAPPRRLEITTRWADGQVRIEVGDNGPGMPGEIVQRVFDPFFTTKPQGVGTGIGLSVCHGIVSAHKGTIAVAARPGGGTLFTVELPAVEPDRAPPSLAPGPGQSRGRILVVEDEVEIAQMMAEVLRRDGHDILLASSGHEALARLDGQSVDLILSDLRMPDLDGPGLYGRLAERWPALARRIVFVTGDVLTPETGSFLHRAGLPVLEKPIDPSDLRRKVRSYLSDLGRA
jgi:PAS domain S-box-containing protein